MIPRGNETVNEKVKKLLEKKKIDRKEVCVFLKTC